MKRLDILLSFDLRSVAEKLMVAMTTGAVTRKTAAAATKNLDDALGRRDVRFNISKLT